MAAAQALASALAATPDLGSAGAVQASPMTWMYGWRVDSNVSGSTGHQPLASVRSAAKAMGPACCAGIRFKTSACTRSPNAVRTVRLAASTSTTPDRSAPERHSIICPSP